MDLNNEPVIEKKETRIRMSAKMTAKGTVQLDITSEASTVEEAAQGLDRAIEEFKKVLADKNLQLAG